MPETTRRELTLKADALRRAAQTATEEERRELLTKARNLYREAGLHGFATWCERWLT